MEDGKWQMVGPDTASGPTSVEVLVPIGLDIALFGERAKFLQGRSVVAPRSGGHVVGNKVEASSTARVTGVQPTRGGSGN